MKRRTFVLISLAALGLVLVSFFIMGFSRLALPYRTARMLAAPTMGLGALLTAVAMVQSLLSVTGIRPLEAEE
ncbi:hypothetical protein VB773_01350 [Haloarculaceae archaeon H-GB2-1]|nr:hypothetical protein [Haloarculaceae archaeon H-GB1-1]MEA5388316.1 hypothetical protein [Haloarculaceae archaeon H-GB11]MEA5406360.1 hypothetical protein [Haloarculaceae archaeon H-GB2-1]